MTPGERFQQWINGLAVTWRDTVKAWASGVLSFGFEVFLDVVAKAGKKQLAPLIARLESTGAVPPELQPIIDEVKEPTGELAGLTAVGLTNRVAGSAVSKLLDALFMDIAYEVSKFTMRLRWSEQDIIQLWQKGFISGDEMKERMRIHGFPPALTEELKKIWQVYLPTDLVYPAWLRDKTRWPDIVDDLKHLGLSDRQLELLKELSYKIPGVQDIIRYVVREAYSPEIYREFGQDQEYPSVAEADAEKAGVRPDHLMKEWISHWDLPSVGQGYEMMHRGEITPQQLALLLKARDIMPFWRDKLTAVSWALPGRIEVRMMAQLGLVDKAFIVRILEKDGLAEEYRDIVADMNLVRGIRTDIQTRYSKGWIDSAGVAAELAASGLSPQVASRLYQWIVKNESAARTTTEKDLTAADIIAGVKKGVITRAQALDLLKDMGYDAAEAAFKIRVGAPTDEEEPVIRVRELTKADILTGLKAKTITQEDARNKLTELRYKAADIDFILASYNAVVVLPPKPLEKELTRADIIKAVTTEKILATEAIPLLVDIGYKQEQAEFILAAWLPPAVPEPVITSNELSKAEIFAGLKAGPLTTADARTKLVDIGYTAADADYLLKLYDSVLSLLTKQKQRLASQADLVTGVKQGLITPEQAYQMLTDLGFTAEESQFILEVAPEASPFSPMSYEEFKGMTQLYRQSQGLETEPITPGLLEMKAKLAQAELEGRTTEMEQQRLQIDTIRRRRRKRLISREQEIAELLAIGVPRNYAEDIADNDDTRLSPPAA